MNCTFLIMNKRYLFTLFKTLKRRNKHLPNNLTKDIEINSGQRKRINITELEEKRFTQMPSLNTNLYHTEVKLAVCKCQHSVRGLQTLTGRKMRVSLRLCTYPLFILVGSGLMQMISSTRIYSSAKCESAYIEWQRKGLGYLYIIKKN